MDMEKLTKENAALRDELQKSEAQFERLNGRDYYQAFHDQAKRANGLELEYGRVLGELGKLQRGYDRDRAHWGRTVKTVVMLRGELAAARTENAALRAELQKMEVGKPATVSEQSTVLRL